MNPNYYRSILQDDWIGLEQQVEWFSSKCDSKLEILFGLSLLRAHSQNGFNSNGYIDGWVSIDANAVCLMEPFSASPSSNGVSVAYLTCQEKHEGRVWDFGLYCGDNNGSAFSECLLSAVIDIDGYSVHRSRRANDLRKSESSTVSSIRVLEESYITIQEAAEDVLASTIYAFCKSPESKLIIHRPHNYIEL